MEIAEGIDRIREFLNDLPDELRDELMLDDQGCLVTRDPKLYVACPGDVDSKEELEKNVVEAVSRAREERAKREAERSSEEIQGLRKLRGELKRVRVMVGDLISSSGSDRVVEGLRDVHSALMEAEKKIGKLIGFLKRQLNSG